MKKTNNKGFSLVELIVVIAIMAVLVGVMAPQFLKYVERARKSTDVQNVQSIVSAIQTYCADPNATTKFVTTGVTETAAGTITLTTDSNPTYTGTDDADAIEQALKDAGINTMKLKSNQWNSAGVVLTVYLTNGVPSIKQTTPAVTATATNDIVNGIYK